VTIAALVLAGGASRRAGAVNKLLAPDRDGRAMVARVVELARASGVSPVIVATGHDGDRIARAAGTGVRLAPAPDWESGMSATLRAGLRAVPGEATAVLLFLADMPDPRIETLHALLRAFEEAPDAPLVAPVYRGRRGHPVVLPRRLFDRVMDLQGDRGARALFDDPGESWLTVEVGDPGVVSDYDSPEALARFARSGA